MSGLVYWGLYSLLGLTILAWVYFIVWDYKHGRYIRSKFRHLQTRVGCTIINLFGEVILPPSCKEGEVYFLEKGTILDSVSVTVKDNQFNIDLPLPYLEDKTKIRERIASLEFVMVIAPTLHWKMKSVPLRLESIQESASQYGFKVLLNFL